MKFINILCRKRLVAATAGVVFAHALVVSAQPDYSAERLDGTKVTRLIVRAADGSATRGTVAAGPLGPAVVYDTEPTGFISGCWSHSCAVGFADELRFANFPPVASELSWYAFSYAVGYGYFFGYCIPGDPAGGDCGCYCPTGGECDEGDPPYTLDAALYDGPPGLCGGGLPIAGTEVALTTTASRSLGDKRIDVRVDLEPKVFVPGIVWGVVTFDIEDVWMPIGSAPIIGSSTRDGGMWIDTDDDGCWDEWECWDDPYGWTCPGCTGWSVWDAEANAEIVMRWQPVLPPPSSEHSETATYTVQGNEAVLARGGEPVWMEIRLSDFDPNQTGVGLKAWQTGVDSSGYTTGLQGTLTPYTGPDTCADASDCSVVGPGSWCIKPDACERLIPGMSCSDCEYYGYYCSCAAGFRDENRTDYIFHGLIASAATDLSTLNYRWASTIFVGGPIPSPGRESYLGMLVLFVPPDAKGTFEIGFLGWYDSALIDGDNHFIPLLGLVPGKITVELGRCCYDLDDSPQCADQVTAAECEALPGPGIFIPGETCGEPCTDCNLNGLLDAIEIEDEPARDCNRNGELDMCEKGATDPLLFVAKSRYLTIPTEGLTGDVAISVTFDDLAAPADLFNGESMWVDTPFERSIHGGISEPVPGYPNYKTATLRCDPVFTTFGESAVVEVHDEFIIPGSTYTVEVFDQSEPGGTPAPVGEPLTIVTGRWGDVTARFDLATGIWTEPDGSVHIGIDIVALFDSFLDQICAPRKVRVDLSPTVPDGEIDILDAVHAIDAFTGTPYPFAPTESPCP